MQSLLNRERILMTEWSSAHSSSLPETLGSVALVTGVVDTGNGYIAIEYSFENAEVADAEIAAAEDEAL